MFPLKFSTEIVQVAKIREPEFTDEHRHTIAALAYADYQIQFPDPRWKVIYLGAKKKRCSASATFSPLMFAETRFANF